MKYFIVPLLFLSTFIYAEQEIKTVTTESPQSYSVVKELRPTLRWKKYDGAHHYLLRWFEMDPKTGSTIKTKQNIITDKLEYQFEEDVVPDRVYQWQIDACDKENHSITISMCPSFLTGAITPKEVDAWEKEVDRKSEAIGAKLGITVRNSGPPHVKGVMIQGVNKNSMAEEKGLKQFDIIIECNGRRIETVDDLYSQLKRPFLSIELQRRVIFSFPKDKKEKK